MIGYRARQLGHRFSKPWVFRGVNFDIPPHSTAVLRGPNGSGKSTLLQLFAGKLQPTEGELVTLPADVFQKQRHIFFQRVSWMGPSVELYNELTAHQAVNFHFSFKTNRRKTSRKVLEALNLWEERDKPLANFSSGMLQRLKLGLALFADSEVLLLDEPTSFMDSNNAAFALELIAAEQNKRTFLLASNLEREFELCEQEIILSQ